MNMPIKEQHIVDWVNKAVKNWPLMSQTELLNEIGLLEGMKNLKQFSYFERLARSQEAKVKIAEYTLRLPSFADVFAAEESQGSLPTVKLFLESGSTLAYVIGLLAKTASISKRPLRFDVLTNNYFGMTGLAGLVANVDLLPGSFDSTFFAFLSFAESLPDFNQNPEIPIRESTQFQQIQNQIMHTDHVFTSCTHFSLLGGPLDTSRANAITKRAIFQGVASWRHRKERSSYVLAHVDKIVPLTKELRTVNNSIESFDSAYAVFAPICRGWPDKSIGLSDLDKFENASWLEQMIDSKGEKVIADYLRKITRAYESSTTINYNLTWLEAARHTDLLIGIPPRGSQEYINALVQEIKFTNQLLLNWEIPMKFSAKLSASKEVVRVFANTKPT